MKIRDTIGEFEATVGTKLHPDNAAMALTLYQREIEQLKAERDRLREALQRIIDEDAEDNAFVIARDALAAGKQP